MTAVERLAQDLNRQDLLKSIGRVHATIERWRREAEELESRAVRHYDVACLSDGDRCTEKAKELRVRAAEVERALEGQGEEKCER